MTRKAIVMGATSGIGTEVAKPIADTFLDFTGKFDPDGPSGGNVKAIETVDSKYAIA